MTISAENMKDVGRSEICGFENDAIIFGVLLKIAQVIKRPI